jgi:predicted deacetylase
MKVCIDDVLFPGYNSWDRSILISNQKYTNFIEVCLDLGVEVTLAFTTCFIDLNCVPEFIYDNSLELIEITKNKNFGIHAAFHGYKHDVFLDGRRYFEYSRVFQDDIEEFQRQFKSFQQGIELFNRHIGTTQYFIPPAHKFVNGITDVLAEKFGLNTIGLVDSPYGIYEKNSLCIERRRRVWCGIYSYHVKRSFSLSNCDLDLHLYRQKFMNKLFGIQYQGEMEIVLHSSNLNFFDSKKRMEYFVKKCIDLKF